MRVSVGNCSCMIIWLGQLRAIKYKLAKAEILINNKHLCSEIDMEELVELILQVLPPHPVQPEPDETEDNVHIEKD
ncbi:hypothetical protein LINPERPRIM_LOCUS23959 [Linum perenne]